jgi:MSHA biogenesis protein MshJ
MLKKIGELELVSIQTLPASELQLLNPQSETVTSATSTGAAEMQDTGVYKHMVVVRIAGGYFELVELLTSLESLSWKFYWEALDYQVDAYPQAEIELKVFTLSSEEGLLGV